MVGLYVAGEKVGNLSESPHLLDDFITRSIPVEFRNDAGVLLGCFMPILPSIASEPLVPWDPTITHEEVERRLKGPFVTFEELKRRLGWE